MHASEFSFSPSHYFLSDLIGEMYSLKVPLRVLYSPRVGRSAWSVSILINRGKHFGLGSYNDQWVLMDRAAEHPEDPMMTAYSSCSTLLLS